MHRCIATVKNHEWASDPTPTSEQAPQVEIWFVVENPWKSGESEDRKNLVVGVIEAQRQLTRRFPRLANGDEDEGITIHEDVLVIS